MGKGRHPGRRVAAFIFDLDGTLIDSGADIAASANFARAHFGLPELDPATARGYVGDGVVKLMERVLAHDTRRGAHGAGALPVAAEQLDEGLAVFRDHYGRHLLDTTRLYPGVLEVLRRYREFPLHLATNKPRGFTDAILRGLHIADAFRRVVGGDETPARKPDPAHLRLCLEGLDVPPEQVAVVGDSPNDILAARALGACAVGCTYGLVAPGVVKAAGPDHIIEAAGALADLFPSRPLP